MSGNRHADPSTRRLRLLARIGLLWALLVTGRLVQLQVMQRDQYQKLAEAQQNKEIEIDGPRGLILDREGRPLAINIPTPSVYLNPRQVADVAPVARRLAQALGMDAAVVRAKIERGKEKNRAFVWIKRLISREAMARVERLNLPMVGIRDETGRVYPNRTLAANLLGWVDEDQSGAGGIELGMDKILRGHTGHARLVTDSRQRGVDMTVLEPAVAGANLGLTIDSRIQFVADEALAKAAIANGCERGSAVVLCPVTGDVLAMSSYPTFDPNLPVTDKRQIRSRVNQATSVPFEPGSTFKTFSYANVFHSTSQTPETAYDCGRGRWSYLGVPIRDHGHGYGTLKLEDAFAKSSNICTVKAAARLRPEQMLKFLQSFGFGSRTGLPLPGESGGMIRPINKWNERSVGYISIGHEIGATTMQLAVGAAVIANGGYRVQPRLILWEEPPGQNRKARPEGAKKRVLDPETAITMRRLMQRVVNVGTGRNARVAGYTTGGKTGSAQIFDRKSKKYLHEYNASFLGFAPVTNPSVVVAVTLNGAKEFGGKLAAPVFSEIAAAAMRLRQVRRDISDEELKIQPTTDDMLADASTPPAVPPLELAGSDEAAEQSLTLVGLRVPDFYGKSMDEAIRESIALGLELEVKGHGLVRSQHPPPGQVLDEGEKVRLTFAR
jgi:cell division protein FtsI (penicillin-binding protein 3)